MIAQSDSSVIDQIQSALDSAQVTGWQVFWAVVVVVAAYPIGRLVGRLVRRSLDRIPNTDVPVTITEDSARLAKWFVWLVALGIALAILGADVGWLTIAGLFAIGITILALRPWIENMSAGLVLTARPAFGVGDQIEVEGYRGKVLEISSHSTVLETVDGLRIHITNTQMIKETVTVYTARDSRRAEFSMNLDGSTDLGRAVEVLTTALKGADVIVDDPAPDIVVSGFDGDGVVITARVWYPSSLTSDSPALDAAVAPVATAMQKAGIRLNKNDVTLEQVSPTFDVTVHGEPPTDDEDQAPSSSSASAPDPTDAEDGA